MNDNIYQTSDLYLAAWLLSKGFVLEDIDRANSKRLQFIFQDQPSRSELVHDFQCGTAMGNLADFTYQLRRAKRLLYANGE